MRTLRSRSRRKSPGQTMTEYMLIISVIVIALTTAVYRPMYSAISAGSEGWRERQERDSKNGYVGTSSLGTERR